MANSYKGRFKIVKIFCKGLKLDKKGLKIVYVVIEWPLVASDAQISIPQSQNMQLLESLCCNLSLTES